MITQSELEEHWNTAGPQTGVLYIAYKPIAAWNDGTTSGDIALAYFRTAEGWIYADKPTPLRFQPDWFLPLSEFREVK